MKIELLDYMGSDLTVVQAARVSFNKESEWEEVFDDEGKYNPKLKDRDAKLINYLATHNHFTPFTQVQAQIRVKIPIFLARQWFKSQVGVTRNEVSRRYITENVEFYLPDHFRGKPKDGVKQGSSEPVPEFLNNHYRNEVSLFYSEAQNLYQEMLDNGIAPEEARMVLPQAMYTEFVETGSLFYFARLYKLRSDRHAQSQWWGLMKELDRIMTDLFPVSWEALKK